MTDNNQLEAATQPIPESRLSALPLAAKAALTLFAVIVVSGMAVSGILVNLSLKEEWAITVPAIEKIRAKYVYSPIKGAALTSMKQYIDDPADLKKICDWCDRGGGRTGFYEEVAPILERQCLRCHGGETTMANVSLRNWGDLAELSTIHGMPRRKLALQTHNHVLGIGLLALTAGIMISFTGYGRKLKIGLAALPFLAMSADIGSWWLCRWNGAFAWVIWVAGFLMVASLALVPLMAVWDMWRPRAGHNCENCDN